MENAPDTAVYTVPGAFSFGGDFSGENGLLYCISSQTRLA